MGIDLALQHTGLAIFTANGIHQRNITLDYPLTRGSKRDPPIPQAEIVRRLICIANEIVGYVRSFKVRHVGIEGYAMDARYQAHQIGEVAGVVKTQLWLACAIVPEIVPPNTARKHVMGYGSPDKKTVVNVVEQGLGIIVDNDHEADACVVGRYLFDKVVAEEKESGR
jgi:Holliday junction resolvasome RuvABC endonuclease subunit